MRTYLILSFSLALVSTAGAAPNIGLKVSAKKVASEHAAQLAELEQSFSQAAVQAKRQLLIRGYNGYVYGDSGSIMYEVKRVNELAKQAGAKPVSKALAERVSMSGSLVTLQHSLVDAQKQRQGRMRDVLLPISLDYVIRQANDLKMPTHEIVAILGAYGFSKSDVERYTKYSIP
jgi:hypothetical protein